MQAGAGSDKEMEMSEIIRLDKYLADMGCGTRSQVKQMIRKGQVEINGEKIKKPEQKITTAQDRVCVAGKEIRYEKYRYYLLHKPAGYVSATTDNRDKTVLELLPENIRRELFPVGRLDKDSEGLILMTNDGELMNEILKARNYHEKEYEVTINRPVTNVFLKQMSEGVEILDTVTRPCKVKRTGVYTFRIILTQGLNRQIRRMCEACGYRVRELKRLRIMNIHLGSLPTGKYREITGEELSKLEKLAGRKPGGVYHG